MTFHSHALNAAIAAVKSHGIRPDRCEILQDASTLVVRLTETLVARVVQDLSGTREGTDWFERETAIAAHLSRHKAPSIPLHPDLPQRAHLFENYPMNFWLYVSFSKEAAKPDEIGKTLFQCHQILRSFEGNLPHLAIVKESLNILQQQKLFSDDSQNLVRIHLENSLRALAPLPAQALHGDAHFGNLVPTSDGLLWTDWEDAFLGPIEWDLASITENAKILDGDHATSEAILQAYQQAGGKWDTIALDQCLIARAAVVCVWYPILYAKPDESRKRKLQQRLEWLKARA